jgi:flagellin-like hook-associated protein FlgL
VGLTVNNNIAALNAYRNLSITDNQMSKSLEKLSSGYRINRAADDAAGLAISEGLRSQIGGLKVAVRNTQDGISVVQTAEGALTETHSILQRMRDLAVQASNDGGLNDDAKANIQSELGQLKSELTRIADTTQFNGTKLLDGNFTKTFQVGANAGETIQVSTGSTAMSALGLGVSGVSVTNGTALAASAGGQPVIGGAAGTVTITATQLDSLDELKNLNGTITIGNKSLDLATVKLTGADVDTQRADLLSKINAVFGAGTATGATGTTALVVTGAAGAAGETAAQAAQRAVVFSASTGATSAIGVIDTAIKTVSTTRANLGAIQNRFDHTINNLNVAVENLTSSESRIRDADMAQEMVGFTRNQILSQAGTAMLAQANQASQGVLSLLR